MHRLSFVALNGDEVAEGRFGRGAIESGCGTHSGLELDTGAWSFWRTEERRRVVADGLQKTQAGHFKLEGLRVDCVRAGPECSLEGRRLAGGQDTALTLMMAGWEPEPT